VLAVVAAERPVLELEPGLRRLVPALVPVVLVAG